MALMAKFGGLEPIRGILRDAVGHILAAENPEFKHFLRSQFGVEVRREIPTCRLGQDVHIALLHEVVDLDPPVFHLRLPFTACRAQPLPQATAF